MVLFLLILGWIFSESLGQSAESICWAKSLRNLQPALKGWSDEGAPIGSPMLKSVSSLLKGKNSTVDGVMIAYLFVVELVGIYKNK